MNEEQIKAIIKDNFDVVSDVYDCNALRFFSKSADILASFLGLEGNEHVLDVATGTGNAALAIAQSLPEGKVTGIDFSNGMLRQARKKAASLNLKNAEFLEKDMQSLDFAGSDFDVATCAFGIFFVNDMDAQLSKIVKTVKPGGKVAISGFNENYFHPQVNMMYDRLAKYGIESPLQDWKRIASKKGCKELFEKAGLENITIEKNNVGYYLKDVNEWWDVVWNAGFRRLVTQLSINDQKTFKFNHLREVEELKTKDGIWLDVEVLFTCGMKP